MDFENNMLLQQSHTILLRFQLLLVSSFSFATPPFEPSVREMWNSPLILIVYYTLSADTFSAEKAQFEFVFLRPTIDSFLSFLLKLVYNKSMS